MKLVRSDSPEVAPRHRLRPEPGLSRHLPILLLGLVTKPANLVDCLCRVVSIASVRVAAWAAVPALLVWNMWVIWRAKSPRLSWVIGACAERVYIRLYVGFGKPWRELDAAGCHRARNIGNSIDINPNYRSALYGPKPKVAEWLVIEPSQVAAENISEEAPSFLLDTRRADWTAPYLNERVYWADGERCINVGWKF